MIIAKPLITMTNITKYRLLNILCSLWPLEFITDEGKSTPLTVFFDIIPLACSLWTSQTNVTSAEKSFSRIEYFFFFFNSTLLPWTDIGQMCSKKKKRMRKSSGIKVKNCLTISVKMMFTCSHLIKKWCLFLFFFMKMF